MERSLDARAVVPAELPDPGDDVCEILGGHLAVRQHLLASGEPGLGDAPKVHDDLEQAIQPVEAADALAHIGRERVEDDVQIVPFRLHLTTAGASAGSSIRTASSLTKSIAVATSRKPSPTSARAMCSS